MTPTQSLIAELAAAHGVEPADIVRAAIEDFALGRSHAQREQALCASGIDAAHGDKNCHSADFECPKLSPGENSGDSR